MCCILLHAHLNDMGDCDVVSMLVLFRLPYSYTLLREACAEQHLLAHSLGEVVV